MTSYGWYGMEWFAGVDVRYSMDGMSEKNKGKRKHKNKDKQTNNTTNHQEDASSSKMVSFTAPHLMMEKLNITSLVHFT